MGAWAGKRTKLITAGVDGKITPGRSRATQAVLFVAVSIGGQSAECDTRGMRPGLGAGALQVNARIPESVSAGATNVVLSVGGVLSQSGVTLSVR